MNAPRWDLLLTDATLATFAGDAAHGQMPDAALAIKDGRIAWLGPMANLPADADHLANRVMHLQGALLTPGLIDCHTPPVFAGDRANEFGETSGSIF